MSYYFIASIRINDNEEYNKYIQKAGEVFRKFKGEYLAVDNSPDRIEGKWKYSRLVLIRFENRKDFDEWYNSEEYQEILKYRLRAADSESLVVKGLDIR